MSGQIATTAPTKAVDTVAEMPGLEAIHQAEVEAVICARPFPDFVEGWLAGLSRAQLPEARFLLRPDEVGDCLTSLFDHPAFAGEACDWLMADIDTLADAMVRLTSAPLLRVRFEVVTDDACRKFHIDNVVARLICTYRGPGTELSTQASVAASPEFSSVPTGSPALFKGKLWPGKAPHAVAHRSPPIEGTRMVRYVVVVEGVWLSDDAPSPYDQRFG